MHTRLISILFLVSSSVAAEEIMYIQSTNAKMLREKSFSSALVAEISKGEEVTITSTSGRWVLAAYQKKSGWISALLLSKNPPLNKVSVISDDAELGNNARRRASAIATAGATRGLTSDDRQRANEDGTSNRRAVMHIEQTTISEAELAQFREVILK